MPNDSGSIVNNQSYIVNEVEHLESLYPATTRKKEIKELLSFIKDGNSAQLIAMPGVGRSNLLGFLAYNHHIRAHHLGETEQLMYHFVLCNFSEIKNRPLFDVMKFLFLELVSSLHERRRDEEFAVVDGIFKDALSYQDELVLFQGLKKAIDFLTLEKKITVVLLCERFETYVPTVTSDFFTNLRSLRSRAKYKFSVIFSTTRPLEDSLEPTLLSDFYEFIAGHHVYLSLKDTVGIEFRVSYLEKLTNKTIDKSTLEKILMLTSGHGKLTRLSLEGVLSNHNKSFEEKNLQEFLLSLKTIQGALYEIWYFLTPDEQQDMLTLCQGKDCPLPSEFLKNIGLIQSSKISIPLFAEFIHNTIFPKQEASSQITYDSTTNTIHKGTVIVSDSLTASEFRLLKLLIDHPDSVIDREQMIAAVWKDTKSFEGVSDQAVDQFIFRLRKKIENDPNNPTHIQTVKGRGIRFAP